MIIIIILSSNSSKITGRLCEVAYFQSMTNFINVYYIYTEILAADSVPRLICNGASEMQKPFWASPRHHTSSVQIDIEPM